MKRDELLIYILINVILIGYSQSYINLTKSDNNDKVDGHQQTKLLGLLKNLNISDNRFNEDMIKNLAMDSEISELINGDKIWPELESEAPNQKSVNLAKTKQYPNMSKLVFKSPKPVPSLKDEPIAKVIIVDRDKGTHISFVNNNINSILYCEITDVNYF